MQLNKLVFIHLGEYIENSIYLANKRNIYFSYT